VEISLLSRAFYGPVIDFRFAPVPGKLFNTVCADGEMKMRQDSSIIANLLSHIGQSSNARKQAH
jgi:hypothetical protein